MESEWESGDTEDDDIEISEESTENSDSDNDPPPPPHAYPRNSTDWRELSNAPPFESQPERFSFTGQSTTRSYSESELVNGVLYFFELFIDDEFLNLICDETNKNAHQKLSNHDNTSSAWKDVSVNELIIFLTIKLIQSIVKKPSEKLYWTRRAIISTPVIEKLMPRDRHNKIKQYLHFMDNETYNPNTHPNPKLNKIWDIYQLLEYKFKRAYSPDRDITIDESLLLYKGRLGWRQYIATKRARFGIKIFALCESKSGYVWSTIIYTGKTTLFDPEFRGQPISAQVVLSLMKPLLDKGYCLTTDNYYTSPQLAEFLVSRNTDTYGTIKKNRKGLPPSFCTKKLARGERVAFKKNKMLVLRWRDKREVHMLSTVHNNSTRVITKRNTSEVKPELAIAYCHTKGGVDLVDQHLADYPIPRKRGKKYYKKIFFHFFELAIWNSFVLFRKSGGTDSHLDFRLNLIEKLLNKYLPSVDLTTPGRPASTPQPSRLRERHFPDLISATGSKSNPTKRCILCCNKRDAANKKKRVETRYFCRNCNVPLCVVPCFRDYHTNV